MFPLCTMSSSPHQLVVYHLRQRYIQPPLGQVGDFAFSEWPKYGVGSGCCESTRGPVLPQTLVPMGAGAWVLVPGCFHEPWSQWVLPGCLIHPDPNGCLAPGCLIHPGPNGCLIHPGPWVLAMYEPCAFTKPGPVGALKTTVNCYEMWPLTWPVPGYFYTNPGFTYCHHSNNFSLCV